MWLKFAISSVENNQKGLGQFYGYNWRDIGEKELEEVFPLISWSKEFYDETGQKIPHDSPHHLENIVDHIKMVAEQAKRINPFKNPLLEDILSLAAIFHDHWKMKTRKPKTKYICQMCGAYNNSDKNNCKNCGRKTELKPITIMGYHGHESIGAIEENLFPRLNEVNVPTEYYQIVQSLIKNHLIMHQLLSEINENTLTIESFNKYKRLFQNTFGLSLSDFVKMNVALSISDDFGRITNSKSKNKYEVDYYSNIIMKIITETIEKEETAKNERANPIQQYADKIQYIKNVLEENNIHLSDEIILDKQKLLSFLGKNNRKDLISEIVKVAK